VDTPVCADCGVRARSEREREDAGVAGAAFSC
jgi:hypothetical protein